MPKVIQVIESSTVRGIGKEGNPFREVMQYHTLDGVLLAETDPTHEEMLRDYWKLLSQTDNKEGKTE